MIEAFRSRALMAPDSEVEELLGEIKAALEGDSNDAEHDALASVAMFFEIEHADPYDDLDD